MRRRRPLGRRRTGRQPVGALPAFDPTVRHVGLTLLLVALVLFGVGTAPFVEAVAGSSPSARDQPLSDADAPGSVPPEAVPPEAVPSSTTGVPPAPQPNPTPPVGETGRPPKLSAPVQQSEPIWPCDSPIDVIINLEHAPVDAIAMAEWALAEVTRTSNLSFGPIRETLDDYGSTPPGTIWVGWKPTTDPFWADGRAVGKGGYTASRGPWTSDVTGIAVVRAGSGLATNRNEPGSHQVVLLHELLHAVGIGHIDDPDAVMYPNTGATRLNEADLAAIAQVACL